MQNIEKIVDTCTRLNNDLEGRYTTFMAKLDKNTGKSRKALTEENIVEALDILDTYRHDYKRTLREEQKYLRVAEVLHKKSYKLVKRYYVKKTMDYEQFVQDNPEYNFSKTDPEINEIITSAKDVEDLVQTNEDYIAVTSCYGNHLSFFQLIEDEIEGLKQRAYTLQQAAKSIRHDQGNFG